MRLGLELVPFDMQVDLLIAELECLAAGAEGLQCHAKVLNVEAHACGLISGGQHQVVEVIDHFGDSCCSRSWARADISAKSEGGWWRVKRSPAREICAGRVCSTSR